MDEYDHLFKVLLIGDSSVGKTSVLLRYVEDKFSSDFQTTVGVDFKVSTVSFNNKQVKLQLWDTAGQDRFKNIVASYYRGAHGILLVYDITSQSSFENIQKWHDEAQNYLEKNVPKVLIGNKSDLAIQRTVRVEDGKELADRLGIDFIETSAKNSVNIKSVFEKITRDMMSSVLSVSSTKGTKVKSKPVKTGCCKNN